MAKARPAVKPAKPAVSGRPKWTFPVWRVLGAMAILIVVAVVSIFVWHMLSDSTSAPPEKRAEEWPPVESTTPLGQASGSSAQAEEFKRFMEGMASFTEYMRSAMSSPGGPPASSHPTSEDAEPEDPHMSGKSAEPELILWSKGSVSIKELRTGSYIKVEEYLEAEKRRLEDELVKATAKRFELEKEIASYRGQKISLEMRLSNLARKLQRGFSSNLAEVRSEVNDLREEIKTLSAKRLGKERSQEELLSALKKIEAMLENLPKDQQQPVTQTTSAGPAGEWTHILHPITGECVKVYLTNEPAR